MSKVLIDTGPIVALFNQQDRDHKACKKILSNIRGQVFTTSAVITEVFHFLSAGSKSWIGVQEWIKAEYLVIKDHNNLSEWQDCFSFMNQYKDNPMDFADATLVMLAHQLQSNQIMTLDVNDFSSYKMKSGFAFKSFDILGLEYLS